jgi:hypothetical protein
MSESILEISNRAGLSDVPVLQTQPAARPRPNGPDTICATPDSQLTPPACPPPLAGVPKNQLGRLNESPAAPREVSLVADKQMLLEKHGIGLTKTEKQTLARILAEDLEFEAMISDTDQARERRDVDQQHANFMAAPGSGRELFRELRLRKTKILPAIERLAELNQLVYLKRARWAAINYPLMVGFLERFMESLTKELAQAEADERAAARAHAVNAWTPGAGWNGVNALLKDVRSRIALVRNLQRTEQYSPLRSIFSGLLKF